MNKKELLANVPPTEPNKQEVVANVFTADKQPVLELTWIDTVSVEPHLVRHFVWEGHYYTYRGKRAYSDPKWTKEQFETALFGLGYCRYGTTSDNKAEAAIKLFLKEIKANTQYIGAYERSINYEKQNKADERKQKRITERVNEITPPLPPGFTQWAKKQKGEYVYLLQWNGHKTVDRRFELDHVGDSTRITEYVRGYSYTAGQSWDEWYYGQYNGRYGKQQTFWDKKRDYGACDRKGRLYPHTLSDIPWESQNAYRAIREDALNGVQTNYGFTFRKYQTDDRAERIVKSGYPMLAKLWREGKIHFFDVHPRDGVEKMLDITKARYKYLRSINAGLQTIYAAELGSNRPYFTDKEIAMINKIPGERRKRELVSTAYQKRLPIGHLITLLGKESPDGIVTYRDYLSLASTRGEDIHDEIIYRNKKWREYHDRHVAELEKIKADRRKKEVDQMYRKIHTKAAVNRKRFGWETEGFVMMVPKRASDIVTEGRLQHHCVGSSDTYIDKMNRGETFIVFLRKEEAPETPYYTIEAKPDGTIVQAYAAYDRKPDWDKVNKILNKWKKEVRKRAKEGKGGSKCLR